MRRFASAVLSVVVASAQAQIVLKPSGTEAIKLLPKTVDVRAEIRGGVADSVWTYTFANADRFEGQADFLIAIPKGGVVHGFAYWYQGEKVVARVTEKERAKRIYQAIVTQQRDPALIEMVGKNTFRVRVFPIDGGADLKVELKMAQPLNTRPTLPQGGGATYSVPLRSLGKVESATVEVTGDEKLQGSWGPVGSSLKYSIANSNAADLKVTEAWGAQALHASLRAARSGGPGGFFALTLTPSQSLRHRRWRLDGDVADVIEVAGSGGSVMLVGRYRKPGPVRAWLVGDGYKASQELTMGDAVEANGPATKLWAWSKIGRSKDRKEIVALSTRHGVPSKYTSWIAIPTEERKRMAREIAEAELQHEVKLAVPGILRFGADSARGRAAIARLEKRARSLGISLGDIYQEQLAVAATETGAKWARAVVRSGEESEQARRLKRDLDALRKFSYYTSDNTNYFFSNLAQELATGVIDDRLHGRKGSAARVREREFRQAALRTEMGTSAPDDILRNTVQGQIWYVAEEVVQAERRGRDKSKQERKVRQMAKVVGLDADSFLRQRRLLAAQSALQTLEEPVRLALQNGSLDLAALRKDAAKRAREAAIIRANGGTPQLWSLAEAARASAYRIVQKVGGIDGEAERRKELEAIAKAAGVPDGVDWADAWLGIYSEAKNQRDYLERVPRRESYDQAVAAAARLREVEALVPPETIQRFERNRNQYSGWKDESWNLRDKYIEARHRGEPAEEILNRFYQAEKKRSNDFWRERAPLRRDILRTLTALDELDRQKADPQVLAKKAELEAKEKELRARMGDPIVSVEAPGAKVVVAKMPDGTWLSMHRVAGTDRWEGRFDVPAGIADGRYVIQVFVDGVLRTRVPINVDTSAPVAEVRWEGGRAEVLTDADVKRVAGFTPAGERVELVREAPGRFAALVPLGTEFVATDGAHNRSDGSSTPSEGRGEAKWTNPGVVSTLAFVGDRLWVGTANDGGGFEGEARDAERPWVKAAVAYGDGLAVRYADGSVVVWDADALPMIREPLTPNPSPSERRGEIRLPRHSTCLAAEGDTLLVGTIGGFFELRGEERKDVFPKELAGLVVTALLRDGERTWVGTQGRGLAEVSQGGRVVWHDERRGLRDDWITCLGRDAQGRIVAGTFVGGASVLDGVWKSVAGTEGSCVTGISGVWISTRQGLVREGKRISDEEATSLVVRGDEVWIGTRQGPKRVQ